MAVDESGVDGTSTEGADATPETREEAGILADLKRERAKRQEAVAELERIRKEQADREAEAAAKRGEFEKLYKEALPYKEQFEALKAREDARLARLTERNAERVEALPEHLKALAPSLPDPEAMSEWLDKASKAAGEERKPAGTQGHKGPPKGGVPQECIDEARRLGKDPEYWFRTGWQKRNKTS